MCPKYLARRVRAVAVTLAVAGAGSPVAAQVVLDGTTGPAGALAGPDYAIRADLGRRAGANLFHSFERFGLRIGESATFSGPESIAHVIGRVTGGERSDIDGVLRSTIPGADLWFLNPAGVVFGPNARLDVPGSFHVSTADELRFADGARFSASDPGASSFTVAAPEAFGFLGAEPAGLMVDRSPLSVPAGEALSLVGGDITITAGNNGLISGGEDGTVRAEAGRITLAALGGPGAAHIADGTVSGAAMADIRLTDQAVVAASGDGGGTVRIEGGRLVLEHRSAVAADNTGGGAGRGSVAVRAEVVTIGSGSRLTADALGSGDGGRLTLQASEVALTGGAIVGSRAAAGGAAGAVTVRADELEIRDGATIASLTLADGDAGAVTVEADRLLISGDGSVAQTGIGSVASTRAELGATGDAGAVTVRTGELEIRDGGTISSSTFTEGDAGTVTVRAERLRILRRGAPNFTGIFSAATVGLAGGHPTGDAGAVAVRVEDLEVRDGGAIAAATLAGGRGGEVVVEAGRLLVSGDGSLFETGISSRAALGATGVAGAVVVRAAGRVEVRNGGIIDSLTQGPGDAGAVAVTAPTVLLADGGTIASSSTGSGKGGGVVVRARDVFRSTGASVTAQTATADAGDIRITAGRLIDLVDSAVTTSAAGGTGGGGNIFIDPEFVVLDGSRVVADAFEGAGGNVTIEADNLIRSPDSVISASSELGLPGTVAVDAPEQDVSGGLVVLPSAFLNASALLRASCAARRTGDVSSFTATGRGGPALGPNAQRQGFYAGLTDPELEAAAATGRRGGDAATAEAAPGFTPAALVAGCGAGG